MSPQADRALALRAEAQAVLEQSHSGGQTEVYLTDSFEQTAEWSEGEPENRFTAQETGLAIRLVDGGRAGFAYANSTAAPIVAETRDGAQAAQKSVRADPAVGLLAPAPTASDIALDLADPALSPEGFDHRAQFLEGLDAKILARDKRLTKVLRATYREGQSAEALVNSLGVSVAESATSCLFSLACVAVQGGETQVGYGTGVARHASDLSIARVIDKTVRQTLALLNGRQVPSGRYDLIIDPWVMAEMLELFTDALGADQVERGKSFLAKKRGERIGAQAVTLLDQPLRPRGLASAQWDAEGCPTADRRIIDVGTLTDFLFDAATARRAGRAPTGNAGRSSHRSLPSPSASNFYLSPGALSPEQLIGEVKRGLYIHNVMGLHTVDTISGDYSLGIMGEFIDHGQRTHGVRGVTIAGHLLDLLDRMDAIANDLTFIGALGSPTVRVRDISVGGSV